MFTPRCKYGWQPHLGVLLFIWVIFVTICTGAAQSRPETVSIASIVNALQKRDFNAALALSDTALKNAPGDKRVWTLRGMAYSGRGDSESALESFDQALVVDPDYLPALEGAAQIEFQKRSPKAKPLVLKVLSQQPNDPTSHALLGFIEYQEKNCVAAVSDFERGVQVLENQVNGLGAYAGCLVTLGRNNDAVRVLEQAATLQPDNRQIRWNLAIAQWKADHVSEALATLQPLIESSSPEDALLLAANIDEDSNDTEHAVQLLRRTILLDPKNVDAYLSFASLCFDHASMQVGIDFLKAGLTQLPQEGRLYLARGVLYAQMGEFRQAVADFDTANRLDPNLSFTSVAAGLVESQEHQSSEALSDFRAAAKAHPDDAFTQYVLAEALSQESNAEGSSGYNEEIAAAKVAIKLDPNMVAARDLLASIYLGYGHPELAIQQSRAALAVDPKDQQAIYHLILALRKTGDKDQIQALVKRLTDLRTASQNEGMQKKRYQLEEISASPIQR